MSTNAVGEEGRVARSPGFPLGAHTISKTACAVVIIVASLLGYRCSDTPPERTQSQPLKDIRPGPEGSAPGPFVQAGDLFFFAADDGEHGRELWASDGTEAGTRLVKDIYAGSTILNGVPFSSSYPTDLTAVGRTLFFQAGHPDWGYELWRSNGTAEGTVIVRDIVPGADPSSSIGYLTNVNGTLFFFARDEAHGRELWKSDGTAAGTTLVRDINPGPNNGVSSPIAEMNGIAYFLATQPETGEELWRSDGTPQGTYLVAETWPGPEPVSSPARFGPALQPPPPGRHVCCLTKADGLVYFLADGLWRSDGTRNGTFRVSSTRYPQLLTSSGSSLFYAEYEGLWRTDGTAEGTRLVRPLDIPAFPNPNTGSPSRFPTSAEVAGGIFYVVAQETQFASGPEDFELWRSDGTALGTSLLKDIRPGPASSAPDQLTPWNSSLLFLADDGSSGKQLWRTDGSPAGTVRLTQGVGRASTSCGSPGPCGFGIADDRVFYTGTDPEHGAEPWIYIASPR